MHLPSRPFPTTPARPRISRCFATTADGRIPLHADWASLLYALRDNRTVALQSRHTCARLIRLAPLPIPVDEEGTLDDEGIRLRVSPQEIGSAAGRIEHCPCCNSPGRIDLANTEGAEFLQLCAPAGMDDADWADVLAPLTAGQPNSLMSSPDTCHHRHLIPLAAPAEPGRSTHQTEQLAGWAKAWSETNRGWAVTLSTAAADHLERFAPTQVKRTGHVLQISGEGRTLQLALPGVAELRQTGNTLHAVNAAGASVLTFAPAGNDPTTRYLWQEALSPLFHA